MRTILFLSLVMILLASCKSEPSNPAASGIHLDSAQVMMYEDNQPDRVIWQKPEMIVDMLGNLSDKTVADIGAGVGFFTFRLLPRSGHVIASDIDARALGVMKELSAKLNPMLRDKLSIVEARPDDPKLGNQAVDVVFLANTYMYIEDRVKYLRNLRKYLSPTSRLLIVDFKKKNMPFGPDVEDKVDLSQVEAEVAEAGYVIDKSDDMSLDYQYIVLAHHTK